MGLMEIGLQVGTNQIEITRSEMVGSWTLWIGEAIDTITILVLILTGIMINIVMILIGGVTRDIFRMSLRNESHLHLMER